MDNALYKQKEESPDFGVAELSKINLNLNRGMQ